MADNGMSKKAPEAGGTLHTPATTSNVKGSGPKGSTKNLQSPGFDTSASEAKGHNKK